MNSQIVYLVRSICVVIIILNKSSCLSSLKLNIFYVKILELTHSFIFCTFKGMITIFLFFQKKLSVKNVSLNKRW